MINDIELDEILKNIPREIWKPITTLSNKKRWAIFMFVAENDEVTFNDIKIRFNAKPQQISNILIDFINVGFVLKFSKSPSEIGNRKRIFYSVSPKGKNFLEALTFILRKDTDIKSKEEKTSKESLTQMEIMKTYLGKATSSKNKDKDPIRIAVRR